MKKFFIDPELELLAFSVTDIITTSDGDSYGGDDDLALPGI